MSCLTPKHVNKSKICIMLSISLLFAACNMPLLLPHVFSADVSTTVCTATVRGLWTMCASATWGGPTHGAMRVASATTTAPAPRGWASVMSASTGPQARTANSAAPVPMAIRKTLKVGLRLPVPVCFESLF